jgi:perosamine synthetase
LLNNNDDIKDDWKIPLYKIYTDDEDVNLITKIIKRGTQWAIGPEIEEFEKSLKDYVGSDYCVTLNSGTSCLHASYLAYGIGYNDEVIVPSFSFISTANSVFFVNANPVFADIEDENFGLDPTRLSKHITPKTKAVVPMDYGGMSCKISEIKKITEDNKLLLIEDAAESLGSSVHGEKVGSISDTAIFSFCGNKVLTTGEGGAVVTNDKSIYEKIKLIRSHGRLDKQSYFDNPNSPDYVGLGYNWRMSSITAALGISQLQKLDKIINMRQENAKYISSRLSKFSQIILPKSTPSYENIYQMFTIRLPDKHTQTNLQTFLLKKKIFCKVYFNPIHLSPFYKQKYNLESNMLPNTEKISQQILTLPMYPNMTLEEKNYLVESISEFFEI